MSLIVVVQGPLASEQAGKRRTTRSGLLYYAHVRYQIEITQLDRECDLHLVTVPLGLFLNLRTIPGSKFNRSLSFNWAAICSQQWNCGGEICGIRCQSWKCEGVPWDTPKVLDKRLLIVSVMSLGWWTRQRLLSMQCDDLFLKESLV